MQVSDDPRVGTELAGYRIEPLLAVPEIEIESVAVVGDVAERV